MAMGSKSFFLTIIVQLYLPPIDDCTLEFMRDVITCTKEVNFEVFNPIKQALKNEEVIRV
jgi:hypothetical protein